MNYIYDIVLNFNKEKMDFYEWDESDEYTYIDKIPIYVVNDTSMIDILNNIIKIDNKLLKEIYNKTETSNGRINYSLLVTDRMRVVGLKFNSDGLLIERSSLLIDEEDVVIEEANNLDLDIFLYEKVSLINNEYFLTRKEKNIKNSLLEEINYLYNNKIYDELNYLYYEIYDKDTNIKNKYNMLLDLINNNYIESAKLYEIIKLTKEKSY